MLVYSQIMLLSASPWNLSRSSEVAPKALGGTNG
jgi:hypothetical protein